MTRARVRAPIDPSRPTGATRPWRVARDVALRTIVGMLGLALAGMASAATVDRAAAAKAKARTTQAVRPASRSKPARGKPIATTVAAARRVDYASRRDVIDYVDTLVAEHGFARDRLMRVFADARFSETAARLMAPSPTQVRRDWTSYRARFVEPVRIEAGMRFWQDNAATLARAETTFGVPAEIIVGILGVETVYGRNTGNFRVIDALTTLAFDYPNKARDRSAFFREQLTDALVLARDRDIDLATWRGSYAGAVGMPQFMPGSILAFAIDFDGDGRIDLVGSSADVIGSVANFLAQHGWVRGLATQVVLRRDPGRDDDLARAAAIDAMVASGSLPTLTASRIADAGFAFDEMPPDALFALIDLPGGAVDANGVPATTYLAGTQNFHVVTRYNRSYFYAYSVIELGRAVRRALDTR